METNKENHFLKFLKEIAIVVIGVLIAVSINKLKEDMDNRAYLDKTLSAIQKEIDYSKKQVEDVLDSHYSIADSIVGKLDSEETLVEIISGSGDLQAPGIKNIALRFFVANKADLVEYEVISKLSEIEGASELLYEKLERLMDYAYLNLNNNDQVVKQQFLQYLGNVIDSEQQLSKLYSEYSEKTKIE